MDGKELLERLGNGKRPESLGLERTYDGLVDLRDLRVAPVPPRGRFRVGGAAFDHGPGKPIFEGLSLSQVDLGRAHVENSYWKNCTFLRVRCERLRGAGINFASSGLESVSFVQADLRRANWGLDRLNGPAVENTEFIGCDLRGSTYAHPLFRTCRWVNCNLKSVNFGGARFENCIFVGILDDVMFHGRYRDPDPQIAGLRNEMRNMDFTKAELRNVSFATGIDLTACTFPTDGYLRILRPDVVYRKTLKRVEDTWPEDKAKERAVYYLKGMCAHFPEEQPFTVVRLADFDDWPGARAVGRRLLEELQSAIGTAN